MSSVQTTQSVTGEIKGCGLTSDPLLSSWSSDQALLDLGIRLTDATSNPTRIPTSKLPAEGNLRPSIEPACFILINQSRFERPYFQKVEFN
jgi:hypothetical protein